MRHRTVSYEGYEKTYVRAIDEIKYWKGRKSGATSNELAQINIQLRKREEDIKQTKENLQKEKEEIEKLESLIDLPIKTEEETKRVEIIILKYKNTEIEKDCLSRIIEYTDYPYKLNFYDNRANTGNTAKIWNKLIRESTCPYVLIMDTDAFAQEQGWLTKLMSVFENKPNAGVVCGVAGDGGGVSTFQAINKQANEEIIEVNSHVSGYCYLFDKRIFDELGYFDEEFYIFGQDSDFIERILEQNKWKIYCHTGVLIKHGKDGAQGSMSTQKAADDGEFNWRVDTERARVLFEIRKKERKV